MNVIYVAYRRWAFDILRGLLRTHTTDYKIVGVFTLREFADSLSHTRIPIYEIDPVNLENKSTKQIINKLKPDIFLFYGWSWMIPKPLYTNYPCLILHTSKLPKYRGGSPLQNQIIRGEKTSAVSIFQATAGIDEGPIYAQKEFSLEGSMDEIFNNIVYAGLKETRKVLKGISTKSLTPKPQDEAKKTYFKRRLPRESEITIKDLQTKSAEELYNLIRSLGDPYPNAYIVCKDGKKLYLAGARLDKKT